MCAGLQGAAKLNHRHVNSDMGVRHASRDVGLGAGRTHWSPQEVWVGTGSVSMAFKPTRLHKTAKRMRGNMFRDGA